MGIMSAFLLMDKQVLEKHSQCKGLDLIMIISSRLENFSDRGVIPRAVDHIFSEIHELEKVGWKLTVRVGF